MDIRQEVLKLAEIKLKEKLRKESALTDNFAKYVAYVRSFKEANKEIATEQLTKQILNQVDSKPIKFKISTSEKETIDSIIMGQVSGINPWNIEKVMLDKKGKDFQHVPMWERTGKVTPRTATRHYRWKQYKGHSKLPFVDILQKTKHELFISTDLKHLQQVIDKLSPFGILHITLD